MSFYLRNTVKVGLFRCTLSKSGLQVSAGVPGLRVGAGPRGAYLKVGAAGVDSYATLPASGSKRTTDAQAASTSPAAFQSSEVVLDDVTGATTLQMQRSQPSELVANLNAAAARHRLWPCVLLVCVALSLAVWPYLLLVSIPAVGLAAWQDRVRRTVVVFYEVDGPQQVRYQWLVDQFRVVCEAQKAWLTAARGDLVTTHQRKVNAGASSVVSREALARTFAGPPQMASNIAVPTMHSSSRSVYLLPDRVVLKDGPVYADVAYGDVHAASGLQRFVEDERVPADAIVVDKTWKYVNKNGGPDRRFKDNRELPVVQYGRVALTASIGLSSELSFSNAQAAEVLAACLAAMRTPLSGAPAQRQSPQPISQPVSRPASRPISAPGSHPGSAAPAHAVRISIDDSCVVTEDHRRDEPASLWRPRPLLADAEFVPLSEDGRLAVVGESHYQAALRNAVHGRAAGADFDEHLPVTAVLVPEPSNPFDPNAVRVDVRSDAGPATVGYVAREMAVHYQPALLALDTNHYGTCPARITGGGEKYYGIYMHLAGPELMLFANLIGSGAAGEAEPSRMTTLPPEVQCTVTGEEHHQDRLLSVAPRNPNEVTRVLVTLSYCQIVTGRYRGEQAIEVRLDGERVGQLTRAMTQRYAPYVDDIARTGRIPAAEAVVVSGSRGIQVELRMPRATSSLSTLR